MNGKIEIDGKNYKLPLSYKDVTLKEFKVIQNFIDNDKTVTPFILENKGEPTEEQFINYYLQFIHLVTKIPVATLMRVPRYTTDESVGIEDLFRSLTWLFIYPKETNNPIKRIGNYHFIDSSGIMKNNDLIEYTEANSLTTALTNVDKDLNQLNLILAIFYRPKVGWLKRKIEQYNPLTVKERAKYFDNVDMQTVYDCLFFFMQSKKDYLKNTEAFFEEEVAKAYQHSKATTGTFLSTILQKVEYLMFRVKMRMNRLIIRIYTKS